MSWARARQFTRTLGFRLNLWYGALFVAGACVLFALVYFLLRANADRRDREIVELRLDLCASIYRMQGLEKLRDWLSLAHEAEQQKSYFQRIDDRDGRLVLLIVPDHWEEADVRLLGALPGGAAWQRIPRDARLDLSVATERLADGATLQVARRTGSRSELLQDTRRIFAAVLAPAILLGLAIGAFVTRRLTAPLRQLAGAVREIIDTRKLAVRVPVRRADDELQELIVLFNRMIEQDETTLRRMKETLDNVAHDVRTPLTRLRGAAENALHHPELPESCARPLEECIAETEHIQQVIQTLLEVARAEGGVLQARRERVDVAQVVEDAVGLYEHVAEEKRVALNFAPRRGCFATIDAVRMRRAFANLLDNALLYTPSGGSVRVEMECPPGEIVVRVQDTGIGISEEDLPRVWERLFRSDQRRTHHGLGLGLSLVKATVEANGGRISVQSKVGKGSEFTVTLPVAPAGCSGIKPDPAEPPRGGA